MSRAPVICLTTVLLASLSACGKKKEAQPPAQPTPAQKSEADAAAPPPPQAPQQAASPNQAPPPAAQTYDAVVVARSIDYFRGQVAHKNWEQARSALKRVEGYQLTPAQRQYVDNLKAQIPAGQ